VKNFFKWFLIIFVSLLLIAAAFAGGFLLDWPLPRLGLAIFGVFLLIVALYIAIRLLSGRSKTKAPPSESRILTEQSKKRVKALEHSWKTFIDELKQAKVRDGADPVAGLPWFLVLGDEGSGKSSAASNSGLAGADSVRDSGGDGFECRVLDESLVFEAPSRFAFHSDDADAAEWERFLALLAKTRKNEPLNGLIVAVPADALLSGKGDDLKRKASDLGKRVDEVVRRLGFMVPVYVLATKCDRIGGMLPFFQHFPGDAFSRPMGGLNDDRSVDNPKLFLDKVVAEIYSRLSDMRLVALAERQADETAPHAVVFPEEFAALKAPLSVFLNALFEKNPYREKSYFRGLFFVSAAQGDAPLSSFLPDFGMSDELLRPQPGRQGFFLKEFFGEILKRDAVLAAPTAKAVGWQRQSRNLALGAWITLCAAGAVALSISFARNLSTTRLVSNSLPASPHLGRDFDENLDLVQRLRQALGETVEEKGVFPRLGLNQDTRLLAQLRETYLAKFKKGVLEPLDAELDERLSAVSKAKDPRQLAVYVNYLSTRINLLQAVVENDEISETELRELQQPDFSLVKLSESKAPEEETKRLLTENYVSYLALGREGASSAEELEAERTRLKNLLSDKNIGFVWLVDWANMQQSLEPVSTDKYWGVRIVAGQGARTQTDKAHTPEGWKAIKGFADSIVASFGAEAGIGKTLAKFEAGYSKEYFAIWESLLKDFPLGRVAWARQTDKTAQADQLANKESPYARILADCPEMLAPAVELAASENDVPAWVGLVYRHEKLNDAEYQKALEAGNAAAGLASKITNRLNRLKSKLKGVDLDSEKLMSEDAKAHKLLSAYRETLREMAATVQAVQPSYQLALETFKDEGVVLGEPKHPAAKNFWAQEKYKNLISKRNPREKIFWDLLALPAEQLWSMILDQARASLEEKWELEVREEMKSLRDWELVGFLWGDQGKIAAFHDQFAAPFLSRKSGKGYSNRYLYGTSIEFSDAFLNVLNMGGLGGKALEKAYSVKISALPTSANPGASKQPHRVKLSLECKSGVQEIVNLNYQIEKTFKWSPADCTDVSMEIGVGDAILKKSYTGHDGFIKFLYAFRSGSENFERSEFPEQSSLLTSYNVRNITVSYSFEGSNDVRRLGGFRPGMVPERIFR